MKYNEIKFEVFDVNKLYREHLFAKYQKKKKKQNLSVMSMTSKR